MRLLHKLKGMIMKGLSKTKLKMIDALTELCRTKPFDQITIKDICEKADISRNTFYYNYKKKDDILFEAFNVMYQNVFGERTIDERYLYSDEYLWDNIIMYDQYSDLLLASEKWDILDLIIHMPIWEMSTIFENSKDETVKENYLYYALFMVYPYFYVLMNWAKRGKKESKEELFVTLKHFLSVRDHFRNNKK